jgi:DNA-binding transcriptional LysR family regulator
MKSSRFRRFVRWCPVRTRRGIFFHVYELFISYVGSVAIEIELRQMRYFLAVAQERSFTRAAARCHVAQPSLSRQIHAIEERLGTRLFDRLSHTVRITAAGRVFEKEAVRTLEHSRRAVSLVRAFEHENSQALRIGLSSQCDLPRVRSLVEKAQKCVNKISVVCVTGCTAELSLALLRGKLDLAVVDLQIGEREIDTFPIHSEPLVAVLPHRHPLVERPMVRLFELKKERFVLVSPQIDPGSRSVEAMLSESGIEVSSLSGVSNLIELLDHVALHRSIGLMRNSACRLRRDDVVCKPLAGSIQLETATAWRKENCNPRMVSLRDALIAFGQRSSTA